jgi:hypothetical protein
VSWRLLKNRVVIVGWASCFLVLFWAICVVAVCLLFFGGCKFWIDILLSALELFYFV